MGGCGMCDCYGEQCDCDYDVGYVDYEWLEVGVDLVGGCFVVQWDLCGEEEIVCGECEGYDGECDFEGLGGGCVLVFGLCS